MKLRPYQLETLQAVKDKYTQGVTRQLVVQPTGCGKTVCFSCLPTFLGVKGKTFVLVHREELASQAADKLRRWNPGARVGIEMAEKTSRPTDDVIVASVPTIGRTNSSRINKFRPQDVDLIICDESHHATSTTYKNIFEYFGILSPDNKKLLTGWTATPNRADGQGLGQVFDEIVYQMSILSAIQQGWLTDVRGLRIKTDASLDNVHTMAGDFAVGELSAAVNTYNRNHLIAKNWIEHGQNRQTVVFCVDIAHAQEMAKAFQEFGIAAQAIWGDDPYRAEKLAAHQKGHLKVLMNCAVLTEGYDDPTIGCIVTARPTKSQLLFVQIVGRGVRIPAGINNLKEAIAAGVPVSKRDCILLDVTDNTTRHSLVTLASIFGLGPKVDLKGKKITDAVEEIEKAQAEHPNIDFDKLEDINGIDAYVEHVNLFEIKWEPEVVENSVLRWHKVTDGQYSLLLPRSEGVAIYRNLLDQWAVTGVVGGTRIEQRCLISLPEAFRFADNMITCCGRDLLRFMRRDTKWRKEGEKLAATAQQKRAMTVRGIKFPEDISKADATKAIELYEQPLWDVRANYAR